jgi:hypothetical protein
MLLAAALTAIEGLGRLSGQTASTKQVVNKPDLSLTISTKQDVVKVGSGLIVTILLTNTSSQGIEVSHSVTDHTEFTHDFDVLDEKGKMVAHTKYGDEVKGEDQKQPPGIVDSFVLLPLEPGQAMKDEIDIAKLFDLSAPGKYTIQIRRGERGIKLKSNVLTVTLTPANP